MRIALLSWESLHSIAVGGVAAHVTELGAALARRGHDVHVFTRLGHGQARYSWIGGVHYHRCPIDLDPDFVTEMNNMGNSFMWYLGETEAWLGAPFDVVHGHDWLCAKGLVQAKNDRGRPSVLTMHSTEYGRCGNSHYGGISERIREMEWEGTYVADRVLSVSRALASEVESIYRVPGEKISVIPNGIDVSRFSGAVDAAACRRAHGVGPEEPLALFVGRMSTQKGPDLLLEAVPSILDRHPDAKVVFVGDGDMRPHLEWRAREIGLGDAVRFTGALPPNGKVLSLFKSSDVVCVPSRNEPFGIVVLEAWAAGKPVIASRHGGPGDLVSHGEDGYLVNSEPLSIFTAAWDIFGNREHARWMGERGRAKAAGGFSWDMIAAQTEAIYRQVV